MNADKTSLASVLAGLTILSLSPVNGAVIFSLSSGDSPWVTENNTSFISAATSGWADVADGVTVMDDTTGTGLVVTISSGITGQSLTTQGADHVGAGVDPTNGFTQGDIINLSFNQDVTLNTLWFGHGGTTARTGGVVTPTVGATVLSGGSINPIQPNTAQSQWVAEVIYNDSNVLAAGETLAIEITTGASSAVGLNAIDVTIVPEPSSAVLLGMGSLALLRRRRK